ncbi:S-adenosylmethionine decarboxylase [Candidatus Pacearchaeota archaeon]|nr:S-adenosylmethionine decarboxylase [Candidatus Pacearchaeota archaeon]
MKKEEPEPWGQLTAIDLHHCDKELLLNENKLSKFSLALCKKIGMKPHGKPIVDRFGKDNLYGYSMMQFIETSTITVHLDDNGNRAFIDVFSCKKFDEKIAIDFAKEFFKANKAKHQTLYRGC